MSPSALATVPVALDAAGSAAAAEQVPGRRLGTGAAEIESALAADGYQMRSYGGGEVVRVEAAVRAGVGGSPYAYFGVVDTPLWG